MQIRAKVRIDKKVEYAGYKKPGGEKMRGQVDVHMSPVSASEIPEDQKFCEATPSGELKLQMKGDVADKFESGEFYYVDFTKVEPAAE